MRSDGHKNRGYRRLFETDDLTFGVGFPLTGERKSTPTLETEMKLANHAEAVGFDGVWVRDVPTYWPAFGDAGGAFDTWPLLSYLAAHTDTMALGTASVVLPLRHPIHVAKSAATVDQLSGGRLVLGVASGDRQPEFPAIGSNYERRGEAFRDRLQAVRTIWREKFPSRAGEWGELNGELEVLPKPTTETLPLFPTGNARQSTGWIADHGDGWLFYHLPEPTLESYIDDWREKAGQKPFTIALRVKLATDPQAAPNPLHLGYHAGVEWFRGYFNRLESLGLDHVIISLQADDPEAALSTFGTAILDG